MSGPIPPVAPAEFKITNGEKIVWIDTAHAELFGPSARYDRAVQIDMAVAKRKLMPEPAAKLMRVSEKNWVDYIRVDHDRKRLGIGVNQLYGQPKLAGYQLFVICMLLAPDPESLSVYIDGQDASEELLEFRAVMNRNRFMPSVQTMEGLKAYGARVDIGALIADSDIRLFFRTQLVLDPRSEYAREYARIANLLPHETALIKLGDKTVGVNPFDPGLDFIGPLLSDLPREFQADAYLRMLQAGMKRSRTPFINPNSKSATVKQRIMEDLGFRSEVGETHNSPRSYHGYDPITGSSGPVRDLKFFEPTPPLELDKSSFNESETLDKLSEPLPDKPD